MKMISTEEVSESKSTTELRAMPIFELMKQDAARLTHPSTAPDSLVEGLLDISEPETAIDEDQDDSYSA